MNGILLVALAQLSGNLTESDQSMKLYHYSPKKFSVLKTLEQQRTLSVTERNNLRFPNPMKPPGNYWEHLSFFFDPVPLDILGKLYGPDHKVWYSGSKLYQYTVDVTTLPKFKYSIVETPDKTKLVFDDSVTEVEYNKQMKQLIKKYHYVGDETTFVSASAPFVGKTKSNFKLAAVHPNFNQFRNKYAATVPHVMIYPEGGKVNFKSVKSVTIV